MCRKKFHLVCHKFMFPSVYACINGAFSSTLFTFEPVSNEMFMVRAGSKLDIVLDSTCRECMHLLYESKNSIKSVYI